MKKNSTLVQLIKYGLVGIVNTLLTALVIWVMLRFVFGVKNDADASNVAMSVSNICGYVVGLINSFVLNRTWTFQSKTNWKKGFLKFVIAFVFCYLIQLGVVLILNSSDLIPSLSFGTIDMESASTSYTISSAYICQLIGIVTYTVLNFFCNKYYTFRK